MRSNRGARTCVPSCVPTLDSRHETKVLPASRPRGRGNNANIGQRLDAHDGHSRMGASISQHLPVDGVAAAAAAAAANDEVTEENLEYDLATYSYHQSRSLQGDDPDEAATTCNNAIDSPHALVRHERIFPSIDAPSTRELYDEKYRSARNVLRFVDSDVVDETTAVDDFVDHLFKIRDSWTSSSAVSGPGQQRSSQRDSRDDSTSYDEGISGNDGGSSRSSMGMTRSSNENVHRETLVKNLIVKTMVKNNNSASQQLDGEKIYRKIVEGVVAEGGTGGGGNGDYQSGSNITADYLANNRRGGEEEEEEGERKSGRKQITPSSGRLSRKEEDLMLPKGKCKRDDPPNIMFHQRQLQQRRQHRHPQPQLTSNNRDIDPVTNSFDEGSILSRRAQHYKQLLLDSNIASPVPSQPSTPLSVSESEVHDYIQGVLLRGQQEHADSVQMRYCHTPSSPIPSSTTHKDTNPSTPTDPPDYIQGVSLRGQQEHDDSVQMRHRRHTPRSPIPFSTTHNDTNPSTPTDPPSDYDSIVELQTTSHHSRSTPAVTTSSLLRPHSRNNGETGAADIRHNLSEQSRDRRRRYKEMLLKQGSNKE